MGQTKRILHLRGRWEELLQPVLIFVHLGSFDMLFESEYIYRLGVGEGEGCFLCLDGVTLQRATQAMSEVHVVTTAVIMHIHASARVRGCEAGSKDSVVNVCAPIARLICRSCGCMFHGMGADKMFRLIWLWACRRHKIGLFS